MRGKDWCGAWSLLLLVFCSIPVCAQQPPSKAAAPAVIGPKDTVTLCLRTDTSCAPPALAREFRAAWVATVDNIDWPSRRGLSTEQQQAELISLLDKAEAIGLNAIIFQVRPAADALYESKIEPWSEYLTGTQGLAPQPFWDPLAFAVKEAHRRGLELHAWFNPYRARHPSAKSPLAESHISRRHPELVKKYGTQLWMDPGEPAVRAQTLKVVLDVVKRYDIDGVHLDDYFYPYKEKQANGTTDFPDDPSWKRYTKGGGTLDRDDWRRQNVNQLIEELHAEIGKRKPWVKFGISPFGIWRPGNPATVVGFDAYDKLYADSRKWLREGWVDYFTPQLYWAIEKVGQRYPDLLKWWVDQNGMQRHLWPGNYTSRVGEGGATAWRRDEVLAQVRVTRAQAGAGGNVHFSMKVLMHDRDSVATALSRLLYADPAIVPASPWLLSPSAESPSLKFRASPKGDAIVFLPAGNDSPRWWLIQVMTAGQWQSRRFDGSLRTLRIADLVENVLVAPELISVTAIDRAENIGTPVVLRIP